MSEKSLSFAAVILIIASFTFAESDIASSASVSSTLLMARVIPLVLVVLLCLVSVPVFSYLNIVTELSRVPMLFWSWYALVAVVSGMLSGITPLWSLWKGIEIMVVVTWMASVAVHIERTGSSQILHRIFSIMVVTCYAVSLWSISEMFREGETLRDYVTRGYRLDTTWPHINSITLSIISLFAIGGGALLTNRMHLPIRAALVAPLLWVFAFSRSRTGLLALLTIAVFSMKTSTISKGKKLSFVALAMLFIGLLASSTTIRERMRMSSWDELARGAGRIRSAKGNRSGWGETVRLVGKSPAIGYGFVIVKRFVDRDHLAVDNYMLQSLVNAGVIGAGPMICYSCFAFFRWLTRIRLRDPHTRRLAEMGLLATCLGFIKSLTTNGMSVYDISLVLFLFGVLTFRTVIQETIRQENMSLTPQDVEPLLVPVKSRSAY